MTVRGAPRPILPWSTGFPGMDLYTPAGYPALAESIVQGMNRIPLALRPPHMLYGAKHGGTNVAVVAGQAADVARHAGRWVTGANVYPLRSDRTVRMGLVGSSSPDVFVHEWGHVLDFAWLSHQSGGTESIMQTGSPMDARFTLTRPRISASYYARENSNEWWAELFLHSLSQRLSTFLGLTGSDVEAARETHAQLRSILTPLPAWAALEGLAAGTIAAAEDGRMGAPPSWAFTSIGGATLNPDGSATLGATASDVATTFVAPPGRRMLSIEYQAELPTPGEISGAVDIQNNAAAREFFLGTHATAGSVSGRVDLYLPANATVSVRFRNQPSLSGVAGTVIRPLRAWWG